MSSNKTRDFLSGNITKNHEGGTAKREKAKRPGMRAVASLFATAALMTGLAMSTPAFAQETSAPIAVEQTVKAPAQSVVDITAENFQQEVIDASQNSVVIFYMYTSDCDNCAAFKDALETAVKNAPEGSVKFAGMNLDDPQNALFAVMGLGVQSVPSILIVDHGYVLQGIAGAPEPGTEAAIAKQWVDAAPQVHKSVGDQIKAEKEKSQGSSLRMSPAAPKNG